MPRVGWGPLNSQRHEGAFPAKQGARISVMSLPAFRLRLPQNRKPMGNRDPFSSFPAPTAPPIDASDFTGSGSGVPRARE